MSLPRSRGGSATIKYFVLSHVIVALVGSSPARGQTVEGRVVAWGDNLALQCRVPSGLSGGVRSIAAGQGHSLAIKSDGTVVEWGNYKPDATSPGYTGVVAIAGGAGHSLALRNDGTVVAWGLNDFGQSTVPDDLAGVVSIAVGRAHSLAVTSNGILWAWGYNGNGQCAPPGGLWSVNAVAAGAAHSLALKSDGTVVAWGGNQQGQCTLPPGLSNVTAIAAGDAHSLALKSDGTVVGWGSTSHGQSRVPSGLSGVTAISAGGSHSLALKNDGTVVAWGLNTSGQCTMPSGLGGVLAIAAGYAHSMVLVPPVGTLASIKVSASPAIGGTVTGAGTFQRGASVTVNAVANSWYRFVKWREGDVVVSASPEYTFAALADRDLVAVFEKMGGGTLVAWGQDPLLQPPGGLVAVKAVSAGYAHNLALKSDGTLVSWGGIRGELSGVTAIAAGGYHNLALKSDGTVVAGGNNASGQSTVPGGLSNVTAIAAGGYHSLASRTDGKVVAWGNNANHECDVPSGLRGVRTIAGGVHHSLALKSDGTVISWGGENSIGLNTPPPGLSEVVAIAAGYEFSLAVRSDGTVAAWGYNDYGQCTVPSGLTGVVSVAAGNWHSLALKNDGTVVAWGDNDQGQCRLPGGLTGVVAIAAANVQGVALVGDSAPEPVPFLAQRAYDQKLEIPIALLSSLTLTAVQSPTENGATVAINGPRITYTPPAGFNAPDTFTYTVQSPAGLTAIGVVKVFVSGDGRTLHLVSASRNLDGSVQLGLSGLLGDYRIQASGSLSSPVWTELGLFVPNPSGVFEVRDAGAVGQLSRFYRAVSP